MPVAACMAPAQGLHHQETHPGTIATETIVFLLQGVCPCLWPLTPTFTLFELAVYRLWHFQNNHASTCNTTVGHSGTLRSHLGKSIVAPELHAIGLCALSEAFAFRFWCPFFARMLQGRCLHNTSTHMCPVTLRTLALLKGTTVPSPFPVVRAQNIEAAAAVGCSQHKHKFPIPLQMSRAALTRLACAARVEVWPSVHGTRMLAPASQATSRGEPAGARGMSTAAAAPGPQSNALAPTVAAPSVTA